MQTFVIVLYFQIPLKINNIISVPPIARNATRNDRTNGVYTLAYTCAQMRQLNKMCTHVTCPLYSK